MRHDWTAFCFTGALTGLFAIFWTAPLMALPPDPQRPFVAQDCPAALARLAEAEAGNPLISNTEMAEVVLKARAQAKRLCPASETHSLHKGPENTDPSATDTTLPDDDPLPLQGHKTN